MLKKLKEKFNINSFSEFEMSILDKYKITFVTSDGIEREYDDFNDVSLDNFVFSELNFAEKRYLMNPKKEDGIFDSYGNLHLFKNISEIKWTKVDDKILKSYKKGLISNKFYTKEDIDILYENVSKGDNIDIKKVKKLKNECKIRQEKLNKEQEKLNKEISSIDESVEFLEEITETLENQNELTEHDIFSFRILKNKIKYNF